ncbi:hypothetical protein KR018_007797 [Drosophila ironensis]|nr:hypothetical protein KR018_007797 [Drosophila ironensis]
METPTQKSMDNASAANQIIESSDGPVLNISGRPKPNRETPRIRGKKKKATPVQEAPKINHTTFPVILSKILLKSDVPPENATKVKPSDNSPRLCFLCLTKPEARKRAYHMFISTEKNLGRDYERTRKLYENKKDYNYVNNITVDTACAHALYRRVQREFTDVVWNKQGNVFETDDSRADVWGISDRVYALRHGELERLINYIKFMSTTKS